MSSLPLASSVRRPRRLSRQLRPLRSPSAARYRRLLPAVALAVLLPGLACVDAGCAAADEPASDPATRRLLLTVVGPRGEEVEAAVREIPVLGWIRSREGAPVIELRRIGPAELETLGEAPGEGSGRHPRPDGEILMGLLPMPESVSPLVAELPVRVAEERVWFDGTTYSASTAAVFGLADSPNGSERWLAVGGDLEALTHAAEWALGRTVGRWLWNADRTDLPDYMLRDGHGFRRFGPWRHTADGPAVDPAAETDEIGERRRWVADLRPIDAGPLRLLVPGGSVDDPGMGAFAESLGGAVRRIRSRLGTDAEGGVGEGPRITVVVERDFVSQVQSTGAIGPVVEGDGLADLHAVYHSEDVWAVRHVLARHLIARAGLADGRPVWAVEGAALWLTKSWFGRSYADWLGPLVAAGVAPRPDELLAPERIDSDSGPLWTPFAAAVVDRLPGGTVVEKLAAFDAPAVQRALDAVVAAVRSTEVPSSGTGRSELSDDVRRGVSLAHAVALRAGYQAPSIGERLDELRALGADAVSLMPFAYQPDPRAPEMRFLNRSPASETDVGMLHAARAAHAAGMEVLWKPQVFVGKGSWPGEVEMSSEEDWARWWRVYRRFVLHHALLAEYAGAGIFSVGVELERTVERPEWPLLIAAVRRVFPGPLTYAANWGSGAERFRFWDRLDAVGVDAYYPLAGEVDGVDDDRLEAGAREVVGRLVTLAERADRPLLLTEVGFAAREGAWTAPHQEGGTFSPEDQARAYDALLGALADAIRAEGGKSGPGRLRGVYVWKAYSSPGEPPAEADFRFLGRPAERVVAEFFRRITAAEEGRPAASEAGGRVSFR